jgi:hypothetical protein
MDAPDGNQASGTRGVHCASETREDADCTRAHVPTPRASYLSQLPRRTQSTPSAPRCRFRAPCWNASLRKTRNAPGLIRTHRAKWRKRLRTVCNACRAEKQIDSPTEFDLRILVAKVRPEDAPKMRFVQDEDAILGWRGRQNQLGRVLARVSDQFSGKCCPCCSLSS